MKLATWNVNSIRARKERLLSWLASRAPDVVCLQELKCTDEELPVDDLRAAGWHVAAAGQKTYNGVAILARSPIADVRRGLDDAVDDPQARLIAGTVDGVRVISAYVPNGDSVGSDKFTYKLAWLERLRRYLDTRHRRDEPLLLCGDFNVAPEPIDVHDPAAWDGQVLFHPEERARLATVRGFGLVDVYRAKHEEPGRYTWWDYRQLAFPKNRGLRIDHVFATAPLAPRVSSAEIDREERKGKQPSDHAPVVVTIDS